MTLIVFEGIDSVGKSTVIKKLKEKYPKFQTFAFPTNHCREQLSKIKLDYNDINSIYRYHLEFETDFLWSMNELEKLQRKGPLLLDRYYISNIVYAYMNLSKKVGYDVYSLQSILHAIDHRYIPDLVVYIMQYNTQRFKQKPDTIFDHEELTQMQNLYREKLFQIWNKEKIKDYVTIPIFSEQDRDKNLFDKVETELKLRDFL